MGKRKLGHESNPVPVDIDSSSSNKVSVDILKHRTCWLHVLANLRSRNKKMSKERIARMELTAPCLLGTPTFSRRKRSARRSVRGVKGKNATTKPKKKLNSEEFECCLENMWRNLSEDKKTHFIKLDSLWFHLYRRKQSKEKVLSWIKQKNIFSKKYVIVPVVCWGHWSLLIFCHFGEDLQSKTKTPCILLLDSLEMANPKRLEADIRKFVLDVYEAEDRPETRELISRIPLMVPQVPQQRDDEECGNFVLYFIKLFVEAAPKDFNIEDYPYFMKKDWFSPEGLDTYFERLNRIPVETDRP